MYITFLPQDDTTFLLDKLYDKTYDKTYDPFTYTVNAMTIVIRVFIKDTPYSTIWITMQYIDQHTVYCHFSQKQRKNGKCNEKVIKTLLLKTVNSLG